MMLRGTSDNFLDVPGKRWLRAAGGRQTCCSSPTTGNCATAAVVTVEGGSAWLPGGFASFTTRQARHYNRTGPPSLG